MRWFDSAVYTLLLRSLYIKNIGDIYHFNGTSIPAIEHISHPQLSPADKEWPELALVQRTECFTVCGISELYMYGRSVIICSLSICTVGLSMFRRSGAAMARRLPCGSCDPECPPSITSPSFSTEPAQCPPTTWWRSTWPLHAHVLVEPRIGWCRG